MEAELAKHLLILGSRYLEARRLKESTVGRLCAADGEFFSRIREGKTFTAKKYDQVVAWFAAHWPDIAEWPPDVPRPGFALGVVGITAAIPVADIAA